MTTTTRTPGLRGRLPKREGADKLPIRWAHEYLAAPLPAPTYPIDVSEGIVDFGMGGNDTYGNCGTVGEWHLDMTTAVAAGIPGPDPANPAVPVSRYKSYTGVSKPPGPGVDLAGYLLWCYQQGFILGFGIVDVKDRAQCDAFMAAGFGLYGGYALTDDFEAKFAAGKTVDVTAREQPDPAEGHCMLQVGATGPKATSIDQHVTWAKKQPTTRRWTNKCRDEAFLVITTEEQKAKFSAQLWADLDAIPDHTGAEAVTIHISTSADSATIARALNDHLAAAAPTPPVGVTAKWLANMAEHVAAVAFVAFATAELGHLTAGFSLSALDAAAVTGLGAGLGAAESIVAGLLVPSTVTARSALAVRRAQRRGQR